MTRQFLISIVIVLAACEFPPPGAAPGTDAGTHDSAPMAKGKLGQFFPAGVTLVAPRGMAATVAIGNSLFVIGGKNGDFSSARNDVERCTIADDGSLGPFALVPSVTLQTARAGHTSVVLGTYLYVIGGVNSSGSRSDVERAAISDGLIGTFQTVPGLTLQAARWGHAMVVADNFLYVIGGYDAQGPSDTIERAPINPDGTLGPFALTETKLVVKRQQPTATLIGKTLYVVGGFGSAENSVERATLANSTLGPFSTVPGGSLFTGRHGHVAIAGSSLYVIGGYGATYLNSVEHAATGTDDSLAAFIISSDVTLTMPRALHSGIRVGDFYYVVGGESSTGLAYTVERARFD